MPPDPREAGQQQAEDLQPLWQHGSSSADGGAVPALEERAAAAPIPRPPPPPPPAPGALWDERACTTLLINLASIMERVDEQLLPALFSRVGHSFKADPQHLGTLTFSRAVVQALASPLAGLLGHHVNRVWCITAGAALWGAMCLGFATTHSGIPFWAFNGVGLALLIPAAQSLTADYNRAARRGAAFGLLHMTGALGALLGAVFATNVGGLRPLGLEGWRFAFGAVALASWAIGACTLALAVDPRFSRNPAYRVEQAKELHPASWRATLGKVGGVLRIPSFLIIGVVGSMPWLGLVFITLYLQLLGFSDLQASALMAAFLGANAAGGLLGGLLGDWAAARWPNHGRIVVCQLSVGAGVPLSALLFKGLPLSAGAWATAQYAAVLVTMGLLITWATPAATNPIFSEIVAPHMRQIVYSFDRSFEGAVAACGAPLVGLLARAAFGFSGAAEVGAPGDDLAKARSLGSALLAFTAVPWTLCVLFFTPLHWTYRRDRQQTEEAAAAAHAAAEALLAEQREAAGIELAEQRPGCSSGDEVKDRLAPTRLEDSVGEGEA